MESRHFVLLLLLAVQENSASNVISEDGAALSKIKDDILDGYSSLLDRILDVGSTGENVNYGKLGVASRRKMLRQMSSSIPLRKSETNLEMFDKNSESLLSRHSLRKYGIEWRNGVILDSSIDSPMPSSPLQPLVLHIGENPPTLPQKRNGLILRPGHAQPACPYVTDWRLLYNAKDINDTQVEVYQPAGQTEGRQWFYTVSCNKEQLSIEHNSCPNCCRGINSRRYASQCLQKNSYVMALVRQSPQSEFDWNWIQIPSSCTCAVEERPGQ